MQSAAKIELAKAIADTLRIREESYKVRVGSEWGSYTKDYWQAFAESGADPSLEKIVTCLLVSGFCEVWEWVEGQIGKEAAAA